VTIVYAKSFLTNATTEQMVVETQTTPMPQSSSDPDGRSGRDALRIRVRPTCVAMITQARLQEKANQTQSFLAIPTGVSGLQAR